MNRILPLCLFAFITLNAQPTVRLDSILLITQVQIIPSIRRRSHMMIKTILLKLKEETLYRMDLTQDLTLQPMTHSFMMKTDE